jgi:hypothetical protein
VRQQRGKAEALDQALQTVQPCCINARKSAVVLGRRVDGSAAAVLVGWPLLLPCHSKPTALKDDSTITAGSAIPLRPQALLRRPHPGHR